MSDLIVFQEMASESNIEKLIALNKSYYKAGHQLLSADYLKWLYLDNPAGKARLILAKPTAGGEDKVLGMLALIPISLRISNKDVLGYYCVNVLSHPDHRTKNIFVKLVREAKGSLSEEGTVLIGHPNSNAIPGWKRHKMNFLDALKPYALIPLSFGNMFRQKISNPQKLAGFSFDEINWSEEEGLILVKNSSEFIKWRYFDCPSKQYAAFLEIENGIVKGIAVTTTYAKVFRLLVHYSQLKGHSLPLPFARPLLLMAQSAGGNEVGVLKLKLPMDKEIVNFISSWGSDEKMDARKLSLACSDF